MPGRDRLTPLALVLVVAAVSGCGAKQPQPPPRRVQDVQAALTGIAQACGEAYQARRAEPVLEREAGANARKLARVYRANPAWYYQADTMTQLVALSVSYLRECGLRRAAAELLARTR